MNTYLDVKYADLDSESLGMDIYLPEKSSSPPLIVYVHGGSWRVGSKSIETGMDDALDHLLKEGFALASLDFRSAKDEKFPAMLHDIKGAVRFLRAKSDEYSYDTERIAIMGSSSGGHLAALSGVSNGHSELEGSVGGNLDQSSDIHAIISYFGAFDLTTILSQSTPFGLTVREPALEALLGNSPEAVPELARLASPVFHLDSNSPPLLLFHGDQDPQMPINQSLQLEGAYKALDLDVTFDTVYGASHGFNSPNDSIYFSKERLDLLVNFLDRTIRK